MGKTLLLISSQEEDQKFGTQVALEAGLSFSLAKDPTDGAKMIAVDSYSAVFVDASSERQYQAFEAAIQNTVGMFSEKINPNQIHFINPGEIHQAVYLLQSPLFGHFISRQYGTIETSAKHYARILKMCLNERAFGLNQFFGDKVKVQIVKFRRSDQKQEAVEAVKNYLLAAKFKPRMASVISNAIDELLMNAIFDAPVDEVGKNVYGSTSRSATLALDERASVEMHVGFDGQYVGISVLDNFGSLDKTRLLAHVAKRYVNEEYKVRAIQAGAGIGLANVFHSGGNFLFASESHVKTEVMVFFKRADSFKEFKSQFRFLSTQFYF